MTDVKTGFLAAGVVALGTATVAQPTLAPDQQAVQAVVERMMGAFAKGDVAGVMSTYHPDAVVVGNPGMPVRGQAELKAMFEEFVATGFAFEPGEHEVIVAGDTALHLMDWQGRGPDEAVFHALSVAVLRRDAGGVWTMVIDHPFGDGLMQAR